MYPVKESLHSRLVKRGRARRKNAQILQELINSEEFEVETASQKQVESSKDHNTGARLVAKLSGVLATGLVATAVAHGRSGSPTCATADPQLPSLPTFEIFKDMSLCPDPEISRILDGDTSNNASNTIISTTDISSAPINFHRSPLINQPDDSVENRRAPAPTQSYSSFDARVSRSNPPQYTPVDVERALYQAADDFGLDPQLLWAVAVTESGLRPTARSSVGAMGIMQLMPATAARYNVSNPYDPAQNIAAGARHLRYLLDYYKGDVIAALAAYNAGEGAVDAYRTGVPRWDNARKRWINPQGKVLPLPPYRETIQYVQRIVALWQQRDFDIRPVTKIRKRARSMRGLVASNTQQTVNEPQTAEPMQLTKSIRVP